MMNRDDGPSLPWYNGDRSCFAIADVILKTAQASSGMIAKIAGLCVAETTLFQQAFSFFMSLRFAELAALKYTWTTGAVSSGNAC